ncbi:MAG TPA: family 3 adenylate cyclase [Cyanobacteria bacterium UBA11372]|nr:family 3 adenylate cyclase [Cyanobacteria bacterium UBA11372]
MSAADQPPKRKRGVILTPQGWQRLQAAKRQSEIEENSRKPYTLEELSDRTSLSTNTLTKIHNRKLAVDRQSLEYYFAAFNLTLNEIDCTKLSPESLESPPKILLKGQVPLNSPFYVERFPIEPLCDETILQPGALIRIKAPKQMGKTSLMARILQQARAKNLTTVTLSLQLADATVFTDLNRFLQWFCAIVTRGLGLPNQISQYWDEIFGANYNCTDYFENYLLANIETPLVLALDEVDVVFNYPEIASDFFGLLRAWYEKSKYGDEGSDVWQKLRLIVVHSTEVYMPLNRNQSPFNVGLSVELPEFTSEQVLYLASLYQLDWQHEEVEQLMALIGGNPYLVQMAIHRISCEEMTLEQLLKTAVAEPGIYSNYLRRILWNLKQYPELMKAVTRVVLSPNPVELEPVQAFKLQSMGLVREQDRGFVPSCDLYRQYFRECFSRSQLNAIEESRLATIVVTHAVNFAAQVKANSEETQNQLYQDLEFISQLSMQFEGQVIKSIDAGLAIYFPNAINAVKCAREIQRTFNHAAELEKEPVLIYRIGIHLGEVIFNYTDITGTGVKIAERLQAEAPAGGIYISHAVYQAVKPYLPLELLDLGEQKFEGIEEPIWLYQVELDFEFNNLQLPK